MAIGSLAGIDRILEPSAGALLRRRIFGHAGFLIGAIIILAILAIALFAPVLAPYDPYDQDLGQRLINPIWFDTGSWAHPLGTDQLGRDYLSRLIYGTRISLLIGAVAALLSGVIGVGLGLAAGYFG
ncbi:MAG TPA: ABC transporter permease, partial [Stellaceae bacterium]|nr:ABC transporter permease [Stellaceae bacterium]